MHIEWSVTLRSIAMGSAFLLLYFRDNIPLALFLAFLQAEVKNIACSLSLSLPVQFQHSFQFKVQLFFLTHISSPSPLVWKLCGINSIFPFYFLCQCYASHHITSAMLDLAVGLISTGHSGRKDFSRVQIAQHSSKKLTNIPKTQTSLLMPQYKVWWKGGVF